MGIKPEGAWFVDDHGNKWDMNKFHEDEAERLSMTLSNCTNCVNCSYCENCSDCFECSYCSNCTDCSKCDYCKNCVECHSCEYCYQCEESQNMQNCTECKRCTRVYSSGGMIECTNCSRCGHCISCYNCEQCSYCRNCTQCFNCSDCAEFRANPERVVGPYIDDIGGRIEVYWLNDEREQVAGGPGTGSVIDLRCAVAGMSSKRVVKEYTKFLDALYEYKHALGK